MNLPLPLKGIIAEYALEFKLDGFTHNDYVPAREMCEAINRHPDVISLLRDNPTHAFYDAVKRQTSPSKWLSHQDITRWHRLPDDPNWKAIDGSHDYFMICASPRAHELLSTDPNSIVWRMNSMFFANPQGNVVNNGEWSMIYFTILLHSDEDIYPNLLSIPIWVNNITMAQTPSVSTIRHAQMACCIGSSTRIYGKFIPLDIKSALL